MVFVVMIWCVNETETDPTLTKWTLCFPVQPDWRLNICIFQNLPLSLSGVLMFSHVQRHCNTHSHCLKRLIDDTVINTTPNTYCTCSVVSSFTPFLIQVSCGVGVPSAPHVNVSSSPSRTLTSDGPVFSMVGGTDPKTSKVQCRREGETWRDDQRWTERLRCHDVVV